VDNPTIYKFFQKPQKESTRRLAPDISQEARKVAITRGVGFLVSRLNSLFTLFQGFPHISLHH
jgi:hypothetical protein